MQVSSSVLTVTRRYSRAIRLLSLTLAVALLGEIPAEAVPQAVDAAQTCPVSAIQIEA